jgi:vancomycin resistance protein YoaR
MLLPSRPAPFAATLAAAALVVAGLGVVGLSFAALPRGDAVAAGVHLAGEASSPGEGFERAAQTAAKALLERPLRLTLDGRTLVETTPAALGATADVAGAMRRAQGFGRQGGLFARALEAWATRRSGAAVAIPYSVPVEPLAEVLAVWKEREDRRPRDARLDPTSREVSAEEAGRAVDVYATADALERALDRAGRGGSAIDAIDVALLREEPRVTGELARSLDVGTAVSRFETHYGWLGGQAGRARNVALAASRIHGLVLLPGVVVSFNDAVGPRSLDAGFANAPEIYKGEMREGVGGGTCQVASTLHAAAFFGGLTIASRANHSRPSAYIPVGLDATVVYPDVDLRLENTLPFPVVVDARAERGALVIELRGPTTGPGGHLPHRGRGGLALSPQDRADGGPARGRISAQTSGETGREPAQDADPARARRSAPRRGHARRLSAGRGDLPGGPGDRRGDGAASPPRRRRARRSAGRPRGLTPLPAARAVITLTACEARPSSRLSCSASVSVRWLAG